MRPDQNRTSKGLGHLGSDFWRSKMGLCGCGDKTIAFCAMENALSSISGKLLHCLPTALHGPANGNAQKHMFRPIRPTKRLCVLRYERTKATERQCDRATTIGNARYECPTSDGQELGAVIKGSESVLSSDHASCGSMNWNELERRERATERGGIEQQNH